MKEYHPVVPSSNWVVIFVPSKKIKKSIFLSLCHDTWFKLNHIKRVNPKKNKYSDIKKCNYKTHFKIGVNPFRALEVKKWKHKDLHYCKEIKEYHQVKMKKNIEFVKALVFVFDDALPNTNDHP